MRLCGTCSVVFCCYLVASGSASLTMPNLTLTESCPNSYSITVRNEWGIDEPQQEKMYLLTCAFNEESNQLAHPRNLISPRCPHEGSLHHWLFIMRSVKILIRLRKFAGRTCPQVRFLTAQINTSSDFSTNSNYRKLCSVCIDMYMYCNIQFREIRYCLNRTD